MAQGLVIDVGLWKEVLNVLLDATSTFELIEVPRHRKWAGNERPDRRVGQGRKVSPLNHIVRRSVRKPITPFPMMKSCQTLLPIWGLSSRTGK